MEIEEAIERIDDVLFITEITEDEEEALKLAKEALTFMGNSPAYKRDKALREMWDK